MASNLVEDLRSYKESSIMNPEEMCRYIVLRAKLDDSYIAEEVVEEKSTKGRRGRKPKSEDASQEEKEKTPEKSEPRQAEIPKAAASQPK